MQKILNKIFTGDNQQACEKIIEKYEKQHFCVVDYVYFANIVGKKVFEKNYSEYNLSEFKNAVLDDYKKISFDKICSAYQDALNESDFLLPDGIALWLFYFLAKMFKRIESKTFKLANLNGTDFMPYFLEQIKNNFFNNKINILLYGTYPDLINQTKKILLSKGYNVVFAQDGYSNLDWNKIENILKKESDGINILFVARSTPKFPIQEIWTMANIERIKKNKLIVMNQGGTFDFLIGKQKRAPKVIRKLKFERLRRFLLDPKRNWKKIFDTLSFFKYVFLYLLLKKE
ncbi:MAG: WecB/TagA/CpsF family glycosyltransferase [Candidatus Absconditabacterales bacterium]